VSLASTNSSSGMS